MDDLWAITLWGLKTWLYLLLASIMVPAMFGFSLGISETYMNILVKTLEVPTAAQTHSYTLCDFNAYMYTATYDFPMTVLSAVGHFEDAQKGPCPQSFWIQQ